jgi:hypothetical protein
MHTYSTDLLLPYDHTDWTSSQPFIAQAMPFDSMDSQHLYQANLLRQPDSWYYKDHAVSYTWNSNGYRAKEWALVDWSNTWIIMGCSHVVGIGVAYEDTLGEQLSTMIGHEVINLGMGGAGWPVIMYNSLRLIDKGIRPQGVVLVSPQLSRTTYWCKDSYTNLNPTHKVSDSYIENSYQAYLRYEPNAELHGYMMQRGVQALWAQAQVPVVSAYYYSEKDPGLNQGIHLPPRQDYARDIDLANGQMIGHFGRATLGSWARALAQVIQSS